MNDKHIEILTAAKEYRGMEVLNHQINIDNYRLAIADIQANHADKPHMQAFMEQLTGLLETSIQEQEKEQVMLKVIKMQLDAMATDDNP